MLIEILYIQYTCRNGYVYMSNINHHMYVLWGLQHLSSLSVCLFPLNLRNSRLYNVFHTEKKLHSSRTMSQKPYRKLKIVSWLHLLESKNPKSNTEAPQWLLRFVLCTAHTDNFHMALPIWANDICALLSVIFISPGGIPVDHVYSTFQKNVKQVPPYYPATLPFPATISFPTTLPYYPATFPYWTFLLPHYPTLLPYYPTLLPSYPKVLMFFLYILTSAT